MPSLNSNWRKTNSDEPEKHSISVLITIIIILLLLFCRNHHYDGAKYGKAKRTEKLLGTESVQTVVHPHLSTSHWEFFRINLFHNLKLKLDSIAKNFTLSQ